MRRIVEEWGNGCRHGNDDLSAAWDAEEFARRQAGNDAEAVSGFAMKGAAVRTLLLCAALAGCGGGDWLVSIGAFTVFDIEPRAPDRTVHFNGTAFLPRGAACTFVTGRCQCELGPVAFGHWTNSATGATGGLELTVIWGNGCVAVQTSWRTPAIALAPGGNTIVLSLSDGVTRGEASVTVVGR